jgi:hypothetical protein
MELILTEAEKKAATWLELDDESVGKLVKASALKIIDNDNEQGRVAFWSAAIILCSMAAEANAETFKQTLDNLTIKGKSFGKWELTIKKKL